MAPNNFEFPDLYWFRKVDQHPDPALDALAQAFCAEVARWLDMQPTALYWFEEADVGLAKQNFRESPCWGRPSTDDPLRQQRCEYFRINESRGKVFHGYTHWDSPLGVMINTRCVGEDLLNAVAEECFHFGQDIIHGAGWRVKEQKAAEEEAKEYVRSKNVEIKAFLQQ